MLKSKLIIKEFLNILLGCKPCDIRIEINHSLGVDEEEKKVGKDRY